MFLHRPADELASFVTQDFKGRIKDLFFRFRMEEDFLTDSVEHFRLFFKGQFLRGIELRKEILDRTVILLQHFQNRHRNPCFQLCTSSARGTYDLAWCLHPIYLMPTMIQRRLPIGAEVSGEGAHFRVWAPGHHRVEVVIEGSRSFSL